MGFMNAEGSSMQGVHKDIVNSLRITNEYILRILIWAHNTLGTQWDESLGVVNKGVHNDINKVWGFHVHQGVHIEINKLWGSEYHQGVYSEISEIWTSSKQRGSSMQGVHKGIVNNV